MKNFDQSHWSPLFWRTALVADVLSIFLATSGFGVNDDTNSNWSRYANWSRAVAHSIEPGVPFTVVATTSIDGRLSAGCAYRYIAGSAPTVLHGTSSANGDLSPFVTYEVATQDRMKWKTVAKFTESQNPATIEVNAANPTALLHVDMEPFRPTIGKFRWGRVVLENGQGAIFAIDDLLPTGNGPAAGTGDFKQDINDLDPRRFESSFELVAVTSFSNRIVGDFIFIGNSRVSSTEIKGTKTQDGDFWPDVTFHAGNSDQSWQALEKSTKQQGTPTSLKVSNQGTLPPLRVALDGYKQAFGRFKYGKIIFSGGEFAVFKIEDLKPEL